MKEYLARGLLEKEKIEKEYLARGQLEKENLEREFLARVELEKEKNQKIGKELRYSKHFKKSSR